MTVAAIEVLGVILILLALGPWWALALAVRAWHRRPDVRSARVWTAVLALVVVIGTATALMAINYELVHVFNRRLYPPSFSTVLAFVILLGTNAVSVPFIWDYYRYRR